MTWKQAFNKALIFAHEDQQLRQDAYDFAKDYADIWANVPFPRTPAQFRAEYL